MHPACFTLSLSLTFAPPAFCSPCPPPVLVSQHHELEVEDKRVSRKRIEYFVEQKKASLANLRAYLDDYGITAVPGYARGTCEHSQEQL